MCPVRETVPPLSVLCFLGLIFQWLSSPASVILLCLSSMELTASLVSVFHALTTLPHSSLFFHPPLLSSPLFSQSFTLPGSSFSNCPALPFPRTPFPFCPSFSPSFPFPSAFLSPSFPFSPGPLSAFHPFSTLSFPIYQSPLLAPLSFLSSSFPALPVCPGPPLYSSNFLPSRFTCRPRQCSSCKNCLRNPYPLPSFLGHFRNDIPPPTTPSK